MSSSLRREVNAGDVAFRALTAACASAAMVILGIVAVALIAASKPTLLSEGAKFLTGTDWNPALGQEAFGALPFVWGTLVTSAIALVLAVPVSLGIAIYLAELAPAWLRKPVGFTVELLAAVPSVIYGLWGFFILRPVMISHVEPFLGKWLGWIPLFRGAPFGNDVLLAGVVLALMVLPTISSVTREVLRAVPDTQREGALALGATRWETVRRVVLPYARSGITGAIILGLGRALGETMAVTMLVGNKPQIETSLFQPAATMASVIANQYPEAHGKQLSALTEIGLLLFVLTVVLNVVARFLVWRVGAASRKEHAGAPKQPLFEWSHRARKAMDGFVHGACIAATLLAIVPLVTILGFIAIKGGAALDLSFFTSLPKPPGEPGGGMANAIVGTLTLVGLACAFGVPLGILAGAYLSEFGRGKLGRAIRFAADVMSGTPSIVAGLFIYTLVVVPMHRFSAIAGGLALAVLMLPTIMRTTEELLRLVPDALREAALALGVPKWRAILRVVLRTAAPGIATGVVLAIARVTGETAPLLFTALNNNGWADGIDQPTASLTVQIYQYAGSPYDDQQAQAWAAALVLVALVLVLNVSARVLVRHRVQGGRT